MVVILYGFFFYDVKREFNRKRMTENREIIYFVNADFKVTNPVKLAKIERQVEEEFDLLNQQKCSQEESYSKKFFPDILVGKYSKFCCLNDALYLKERLRFHALNSMEIQVLCAKQ